MKYCRCILFYKCPSVFIKRGALIIIALTCCQYNQAICAETLYGNKDALVMVTYWQIQEFCPENKTIEAYLERVELYFEANNISEDKQVAVFRNVIGGKNYTLLCNLLAPQELSERTLADLADALKTHLGPKRIVIAERFQWAGRWGNCRWLWSPAIHCQFENTWTKPFGTGWYADWRARRHRDVCSPNQISHWSEPLKYPSLASLPNVCSRISLLIWCSSRQTDRKKEKWELGKWWGSIGSGHQML